MTTDTVETYSKYAQSLKPMELPFKPTHDGTYWQPGNRANQIRSATQELCANDVGSMTLSQYQDFVKLDWLRPHGHFTTVLAMEEHLMDEHKEFKIADDITRWSRTEKLLSDDVDEVISELGDILWLQTAQVTSAGVDESGVERLGHRLGGVMIPSNATIDDIDRVIKEGNTPRLGIDDGSEELVMNLFFGSAFVCVGTKIAIEDFNDHGMFGVEAKRGEVASWASMGMGLIAMRAQELDASLADVVRKNIQKITARAKNETLTDKAARSKADL